MSQHPQNPTDLLPLTPVVLHTLLTLTEGTRHGYAIAQEVEKASQGRVRMGPGTLYGTLQRMAGLGLIEESERRGDSAAHGQRRRYYGLTAWGGQVLEAELKRLSGILELARDKRTRVRDQEAQA